MATLPTAQTPWRKDIFKMLVRGENGPKEIHVAGLTDGVFGLDRRKCFDDDYRLRTGYVVTHLRTGFAVRYLVCNLPQAKEAVKLLHAASWDFSSPAEAAASPERIEATKRVNRLGFVGNASDFQAADPYALRDSGSDRNGEDAPAAECEASQSGPKGIAQDQGQ